MYHPRFIGSHYEAGNNYGKLLLKNGKILKNMHIMNSSAERREHSLACIKVLEDQYPEILEELRGIAEGQEMDIEDLAAFILGMYSFTLSNFCTCFASRSGNTVIFGRNSDFLVELEKYYVSCYYKLDNCFSFIGNSTAMVQMEDGVNEHGLAAGLTFIYPAVIKPGLNAGILVRYILEKCKNVEEALCALNRLKISSSQTITLADKSGQMAVVECNSEKLIVIKPRAGENFVVTANDFNSDEMLKYRCGLGDDLFSGLRYQVAYDSLKKSTDYSLEYAKNLLSGKFGFMCQYDRAKGADTVWSSVYVLNESKVYRCEGNPSRKGYKEDKRLKIK